jgi:hypothetical protein
MTAMMTTTRTTPIVGDSLLEKLPPEVLKNILSEVVGYVAPPSTMNERGVDTYRISQDVRSDIAVETVCLSFRLVSHTLRRSSWRALAKVINETIFDMGSKDSVETLIAVAGCEPLSPWIGKLTISCFRVTESYPIPTWPWRQAHELAGLDASTRAELLRIQETDASWHPDAWRKASREEDAQPKTIPDFSICPTADTLIEILATAMSSLANLMHIRYYYLGEHIPARFMKMARSYRARGSASHEFRIKSYKRTTQDATIGLQILIKAIVASGIEPRKLDLAMNLKDQRHFLDTNLTENLAKVFHFAEELTVRGDIYHDEFFLKDHPFASTSSTSSSRSRLRFMTIEPPPTGWHDVGSFMLLSHLLGAPDLKHITVVGGDQVNEDILGFLQLFKGKLKSVTLRYMTGISYEPILKCLQSFELDLLTVYDFDGWWDDDIADGYQGVSRGFLESIAKRMELYPE